MSSVCTTMTIHAGREIMAFGRLKRYPGGIVELMAANRPIFVPSGWEPSVASQRAKRGTRDTHSTENVQRAIRRARGRVRDIALANKMDYFVTLTLSPDEVDRYDIAAVLHRMRTMLDNQVRRHGLRYVLVPEHHKDGAVHFHGFLGWGAEPPQLVDSGTMVPPKGGKPRKVPPTQATKRAMEGWKSVYNLPWWHLGYSTAMPVTGTYEKAVGYVLKYVGKGMDQGRIGGRWYYSGGHLEAPEISCMDLDLAAVAAMPGAWTGYVAQAGLHLAIWRGREVMSGDTAGSPDPDRPGGL